jgi:hypothetical protein
MIGESTRMRSVMASLKEHGTAALQEIAGGKIAFAVVCNRPEGGDPVPVLVVDKGRHRYFCSFLPADGTSTNSTVCVQIEEDTEINTMRGADHA